LSIKLKGISKDFVTLPNSYNLCGTTRLFGASFAIIATYLFFCSWPRTHHGHVYASIFSESVHRSHWMDAAWLQTKADKSGDGNQIIKFVPIL
jgi:hypothetical protein